MTIESHEPEEEAGPSGSTGGPGGGGPGADGREAPRGLESLTSRELTIVELVLEGLTNPEIGQRLDISRRTVSSHLSAVFRKLRVRSRIDLILRAPELKRQAAKLEDHDAKGGLK